jgi:hypothetical protein
VLGADQPVGRVVVAQREQLGELELGGSSHAVRLRLCVRGGPAAWRQPRASADGGSVAAQSKAAGSLAAFAIASAKRSAPDE